VSSLLFPRSPDFVIPNLSGETAVSPKVNPSAESRHVYPLSAVDDDERAPKGFVHRQPRFVADGAVVRGGFAVWILL
jgi:hypothetical protein